MGEKYRSLDAKTRFALLNSIAKSVKSVGEGKVKYLDGINDQMIAKQYGVHVTTVARSRRDVFGELVRGPNGPHKKGKAAANNQEVLDLIRRLNSKMENMNAKIDALAFVIKQEQYERHKAARKQAEAARKQAEIRKLQRAPGITSQFREVEPTSESGHAVYTRETEEDKPTSYVK